MKDDKLKFGTRLLIGGIAGFAGTMAMTAAMRRMHQRLPEKERYPLTPREIVDSGARQVGVDLSSEAAKDVVTAAHFLYGALAGAMIAAMNPDPKKKTGAAAGVAVWLASYMGWIPAAGMLTPATKHPVRRTGLMIAAHLVWGAATAAAIRELRLARETMLADGQNKDAPGGGREAASPDETASDSLISSAVGTAGTDRRPLIARDGLSGGAPATGGLLRGRLNRRAG